MKKGAYTLVELLVVIAIIVIVSALVTSVLTSGKDAARATRSIQGQRQIFIAASIYRTNHSGDIEYGSLVDMGLPTVDENYLVPWSDRFNTPTELWEGCGPHASDHRTQTITYFFIWTNQDYTPWILEYRDKLPLTFDMHCTPADRHIENNYETRYGLAVTLGGNLIRRWSKGDPLFDPEFWVE